MVDKEYKISIRRNKLRYNMMTIVNKRLENG
jgi:hypothetical protein